VSDVFNKGALKGPKTQEKCDFPDTLSDSCDVYGGFTLETPKKSATAESNGFDWEHPRAEFWPQ
jgi:hypothetical protein